MHLRTLVILALVAIVAALEGKSNGWKDAHIEVARECQRLGSFYVGDQIFTCSLKDK